MAVLLFAGAGYDGHFTNKQGKVREGSATFWRASRFVRLHTQDILLRDVFKQVRRGQIGRGGRMDTPRRLEVQT